MTARLARFWILVLTAIAAAATPLVIGLIRLNASGFDVRMLGTALASTAGACLVLLFYLPRARASLTIFLTATLFGALSAWLLGASTGPGLVAIAVVFGLCLSTSNSLYRSATSSSWSGGSEVPAESEFSYFRKPSAIAPLLMSFAALTLVVAVISFKGVVHEPDEGTPAHLFQILIVAQIPVIAWFVVRWLPRDPWRALPVLVVHVAGVATAVAPIVMLGM